MLITRTAQRLASAFLITVSSVALYFCTQLQFDEHHEDLFRTDDAQFARYQHFVEKFPAEQQEISILLQSKSSDDRQDDLFTAEKLSTLLAAHIAIEGLPIVAHVVSIFSVPRLRSLAEKATDNDNLSLSELQRKLSNRDYWPSRFLSEDHKVMVFVVALSNEGDQSASSIKRLLLDIDSTVQASLASSSLVAQATGFPSLRIALRDQIKADTIKYTVLAFLLSMLVAYIYFRSIVLVVATLIGPLSAVLWVFAVMSAVGLTVNVLTQMVGVLILVVSYTDALHLIASCRRNLRRGLTADKALYATLISVAPACLLTSLTSAAGFISLTLSKSPAISQFGVLCAVGTLSGFVAVMLALPLITFICNHHSSREIDQNSVSGNDNFSEPTRQGLEPDDIRKRSRIDRFTVIAGILTTLVLLVSTALLKTDYSFTENLPKNHPASAALALADDSVDGQLPLHVMLEWSSDVPVKRRQMIAQIRTLQSQLNQATGRDWISITDLIRLAPGFGTVSKLRQIPPFAAEHFFLPKDQMALVTTHMTSAGASDVRQVMDIVNPVLYTFQQSHPDLTVSVAGFLSLVGSGSQYMISDLGKSLFGATIIIFALNVLLFRSLKLGLISLMPNIAPIAAVGAVLVWSGEPLRYSSVVLFSICLGLAIDDTVHYLVRFRQHRKSGIPVAQATQLTSTEVGQVLILTTLIMCAGFGALFLSTTPAIVGMGALACIALLVALASDLLLLPALLRRYYD